MDNSTNNKNGVNMIGPAAREILNRSAVSTIFKPAQTQTPPAKSLNDVIQQIKPPDFSNKMGSVNIPTAPNLTGSSYKSTIPTITLPDFKNLIPKINFDK